MKHTKYQTFYPESLSHLFSIMLILFCFQAKAHENPDYIRFEKIFNSHEMESTSGKKIKLNSLSTEIVIVNFWASWCMPCRQENPNVVAIYNELHSKGLNIIGVSLDKDKAKWKEAIAKDKLTWTQVSNLKFWDEPIAKQYHVESIPATFILDASGNVVAKDLRGEALKAKIIELLAK